MVRRLAVLVLVAVAGLALAQPKYGGTLVAGMQTHPVGLDPHITNATSTRNMLENVYDTLVMFDSSLQIVPGLAESWEVSEDGLTCTFTLSLGVRFHDGDTLQATDVVFSMNKFKVPALSTLRDDDFAVVADIQATVDLTVVMKLAELCSSQLLKLVHRLNVVV